MRGAFSRCAGAVALVLLPSLAHAQGTLTGTVRDVSGAVLPGVTVEATAVFNPRFVRLNFSVTF